MSAIRSVLLSACLALTVTAASAEMPAPVGPEVRAFAFHSRRPEIVYAATHAGVFKSTDSGTTWTRTLGDGNVWALVARPDQPDVLFAGVEGNKSSGMLVSRDAGISWDPVPSFAGKAVWALAIDSRRPDIMFAVTSPDFGAPGRYLYRSQDGGSTWNLILRGREITVGGVAMDSDGTVYVGLVGEMLRSSDLGETWTASRVVVEGRSPYVSHLMIDPANPRMLRSRSTSGLIETSDGGATWRKAPEPKTPTGAGLPRGWFAIDVASHPTDPAVVFASWANGGVYKSKDGGATWSPACKGITWRDLGVSRAGMQGCEGQAPN